MSTTLFGFPFLKLLVPWMIFWIAAVIAFKEPCVLRISFTGIPVHTMRHICLNCGGFLIA